LENFHTIFTCPLLSLVEKIKVVEIFIHTYVVYITYIYSYTTNAYCKILTKLSFIFNAYVICWKFGEIRMRCIQIKGLEFSFKIRKVTVTLIDSCAITTVLECFSVITENKCAIEN
jgi:hypothetical protein